MREADKAMGKQLGQDVIDSLSVLKVTAPTLHENLHHRLVELLLKLSLALRSRHAIIRQCTAKCFATICGVITTQAMKHVIEHVIPYLGDGKSTVNRQGVVELIYREQLGDCTIHYPTYHSHRCDTRIGYQGFALCHFLDCSHTRTDERHR